VVLARLRRFLETGERLAATVLSASVAGPATLSRCLAAADRGEAAVTGGLLKLAEDEIRCAVDVRAGALDGRDRLVAAAGPRRDVAEAVVAAVEPDRLADDVGAARCSERAPAFAQTLSVLASARATR